MKKRQDLKKPVIGIIATIIFLIMIILLIISMANKRDLSEVLKSNGLDTNLNGYLIDDMDYVDFNNEKSLEIIATGNYFLTIKIIKMNESSAKVLIGHENYIISSTYSKYVSPYPGPVTNLVGCDEKYMPVKNESEDNNEISVRYDLFANQRKVFGDCDKDTIKYESRIYYLFCKKNNILYDIKIFSETGKKIGNLTFLCN